MIYHDSDLFYETYNTITEHNQRKTHYLLSIRYYFDIYFQVNEKLFYNFVCFIISYDFYITLFEYITRSSSLSMGEIKLFAIVN